MLHFLLEFPRQFLQLSPVYFSCAAKWHRVEEVDTAWVCVRCAMLQVELLELVFGSASGSRLHDECNWNRALNRVTYGYDIGFPNTRMAQQNIDNLFGVDVFARDIDHVVFASHEIKETVLVPTHKISGV